VNIDDSIAQAVDSSGTIAVAQRPCERRRSTPSWTPAATTRSVRTRPDLVETPSGHTLAEITLEAARAGSISGLEDPRNTETLQRQADIARASGRPPLAENLERAAELARVPRRRAARDLHGTPSARSTAEELERWAVALEGWGAGRTAAFVREATAAYLERGLLAV